LYRLWLTITDYDENSTNPNISIIIILDTQISRIELAMSADNPATTQQWRTDLMACKLWTSGL
jgi:hypothetical protein